jgi:hypothetical protein
MQLLYALHVKFPLAERAGYTDNRLTRPPAVLHVVGTRRSLCPDFGRQFSSPNPPCRR